MLLHPVNILLAGIRESLIHTELGMGMEISDDLQAVKTRQYRFYLLMSPVMRYYAFQLSAGCLETEGMFYYEPVFQLVSQQKAEAFTLVNFCRA